LVFEIFDLKIADPQTNKHTNPQNSTPTDNKGPLKLSAREPIDRAKTVEANGLINVWSGDLVMLLKVTSDQLLLT